jgi:Rab GDP dissociation inhibitor
MLSFSAACSYVQEFDEKNPATYKGLNLYNMPMSALYAHFGLDAQTIDFIGHALALHRCAAWVEVAVLLLLS